MLVKEIMSNQPQYVSPETTLKEAASLLRDNDFGFLPIGKDDKLIGTVTDRDITINAVAQGLDPSKTPVSQIMAHNVLYCFEKDPIEKAAEYMEKNQIHRLIVLNDKKRMTGILSVGDVARKSHNDELCGQIIEGISEVA